MLLQTDATIRRNAVKKFPGGFRVQNIISRRISKTGGFCSYSTNLIFERSRGLASGLSSG